MTLLWPLRKRIGLWSVVVSLVIIASGCVCARTFVYISHGDGIVHLFRPHLARSRQGRGSRAGVNCGLRA